MALPKISPAKLRTLNQEQLLDLKISQLDLSLEAPFIQRGLRQLNRELKSRGIQFEPYCWLSTEWFVPDRMTGMGIPFYLADPVLRRLERKMMLSVEGDNHLELMKILRHETGHAIDNAYRLHRKQAWREVFGNFSDPYPDHYTARPNSRRYVMHLDSWYAQAHPAEDYAETFAVWLDPKSNWRTKYRRWAALEKLELIEQLIAEVSARAPVVKTKKRVETLASLNYTLRKYYRDKQKVYSSFRNGYFDQDLKKIFSADMQYKKNITAYSFIASEKNELQKIVASWTGTPVYSVSRLLQGIQLRTKKLKLRLCQSPDRTRQELLIMIALQTVSVVHKGRYTFTL